MSGEQLRIDFDTPREEATRRLIAMATRQVRALGAHSTNYQCRGLIRWVWNVTTRKGWRPDLVEPAILHLDDVAEELECGRGTARRIIDRCLQTGLLHRRRRDDVSGRPYEYWIEPADKPAQKGLIPKWNVIGTRMEPSGYQDGTKGVSGWNEGGIRMEPSAPYDHARASSSKSLEKSSIDRSTDRRSECPDEGREPELVDLQSTQTDAGLPGPKVELVRNVGNELLERLGFRAAGERLDDRDRSELWRVAWLLSAGILSEADVAAAVEAVRTHRPRKPMAYFRSTLRNELLAAGMDLHRLERLPIPDPPPRSTREAET